MSFFLCPIAILIIYYDHTRVPVLLDGVRRSIGTDIIGRANQRAKNLFLAIVISYLVCWTPNHVIVLWQVFLSTVTVDVFVKESQ